MQRLVFTFISTFQANFIDISANLILGLFLCILVIEIRDNQYINHHIYFTHMYQLGKLEFIKNNNSTYDSCYIISIMNAQGYRKQWYVNVWHIRIICEALKMYILTANKQISHTWFSYPHLKPIKWSYPHNKPIKR